MADEKKKNTTKKTTPESTSKKTKSKNKNTKITKQVEKKENIVESKTTKKNKTKEPEKKVQKKVEEKVETKQEQLERTIIFDGAQKRNLKEVVERLEKENVVLKDKVVKRSKANKFIVITLIILILAVMVYCSIYTATNIKSDIELKKPVETLNTNIFNKVENLSDKEKTKAESNEDKKDNKKENAIIEINLKEFEQKILNKENMNILVSSTSCYFCYTFEPTVEKVLKELDKKIYKIDIYKLTKEEVNKFREYYAFRITPTIFTVEDGIVTKEKTGSQSEEDFKSWAQDNLL